MWTHGGVENCYDGERNTSCACSLNSKPTYAWPPFNNSPTRLGHTENESIHKPPTRFLAEHRRPPATTVAPPPLLISYPKRRTCKLCDEHTSLLRRQTISLHLLPTAAAIIPARIHRLASRISLRRSSIQHHWCFLDICSLSMSLHDLLIHQNDTGPRAGSCLPT